MKNMYVYFTIYLIKSDIPVAMVTKSVAMMSLIILESIEFLSEN